MIFATKRIASISASTHVLLLITMMDGKRDLKFRIDSVRRLAKHGCGVGMDKAIS